VRKLIQVVCLAGVVGFAALVGCSIWCMQAPAIPYSTMDKLRIGMNRNEVVALLGEPGSKFAESDGSQRWVYSRMTWAMYKVWVGSDGTVVRLEHDF
jgi:outer membrane protein assembly factor BamE (lipoprotein component of BamABCDE complex)